MNSVLCQRIWPFLSNRFYLIKFWKRSARGHCSCTWRTWSWAFRPTSYFIYWIIRSLDMKQLWSVGSWKIMTTSCSSVCPECQPALEAEQLSHWRQHHRHSHLQPLQHWDQPDKDSHQSTIYQSYPSLGLGLSDSLQTVRKWSISLLLIRGMERPSLARRLRSNYYMTHCPVPTVMPTSPTWHTTINTFPSQYVSVCVRLFTS